MSNDLPQGWSRAPLGSLGRYINGRAFKPAEWERSGLPIIRIQNLNDPAASFNYSTREHDERFRVRKGDLLIAWSASLGAFIWHGGDAWLNQHIFRVEPQTRRCTKIFLLHAVRHAIDELYDKAHGSGMVHVTKPVFEAHEVPLPPLAEQRRIVAKLETLLGKVDASQQRLAKIPVLLKRFRQSVLAAACSGRLTADWRDERDIDDEWPVEPLSELFVMRNGKSLIATKRRGGDVPVYGGNGHMGTHNEANADGLVIVIGRVGAQCGNVHYVSGKVWVTDNAISLQSKRELVPAFYAFFLRSLNLNQLSAGTGQPYVSQEILGPIETPVVTLPEQQEIVRRVEGLFALADQLEVRLAKARGQVEKLTPSLLARAFAGQLVPQDPTDEPAEKLLERIRGHKV